MKKAYRYRLPEGFVALKNNVGELLRDARDASFEYGEMPRREFAQLVGVSRETLSRIENGARWPSYRTLMEIIGLLRIEWSHIAIKGASSKKPIRATPEVCCQLGEALTAAALAIVRTGLTGDAGLEHRAGGLDAGAHAEAT